MSKLTSPSIPRADTSLAHWDDPPDWMIALAQEVEATSVAATAKRCELSRTAVSLLLANRYGRPRADGSGTDTSAIAQKVRATLMAAEVTCPVMGEIPLALCLENQGHVRGGVRGNALRNRLMRACPVCVHASKRGER